MYRPRVIPVLQLKGKGLVKTTTFKNSRYIGDPINAVKIFNNFEADELIFVDISATNENRSISVELVKQIGDEAYMPFAVGGGIKRLSTAIELINAGAEKIILNTLFGENPKIISQIAKTLGSQSVVVSIDIKRNWFGKYRFYINSGRVQTKLDPISAAKKAVDLGVGEIVVNYINYDGLMKGYNLELIKSITESVSIPVIAACGAGNMLHMKQAIESGAQAVAAGSLFVYHGSRKAILINYPPKTELIF